ncbi:MAG TPA: mycofactocin biosynthesis glycosyltransferase MftF [Ktedonobacteraceae bacterium]|nr:mycofactocin biosynthesis glycosyltransferase MftF [Ktedonobacteraceae bacterium]
MKVPYQRPQPGCYRLARGVRIHGETLICDYPLRVLRPGPTTLRLIASCSEERTCAELAALLKLPLKRIEMLCGQLYWKGLLDAGPPLEADTWPGVSIIIPSYNRARQLERCLVALLNLHYPSDCIEVIIVDDASNDTTGGLVKRLEGEYAAKKIALHVVRHARQRGVATARNSGAEQARMEVLAFIDSDCVATPGWLKELTPVFEDAHISAVGGMIRACERRSMLGKYEDVCSSLFMGVRPQQVKLEGPLTYLPTANFLVRRSAWQKVDGFAPLTFGEDVDFCRRLLLSGSSIRYEPRGIVLHDYRTTLPGFVKTRISYASAEAALLKRHPTERRVLLLPPEQATFAGLTIGGLFGAIYFILAIVLTLFGARKRLVALSRQRISLNPLVVLRATLRGHLSYVYHLCRHLTRYYTLPALLVGMIFPPLLLLVFILCSIVIGVDYARLRPRMTISSFTFCSLLDDCAYEIGVLLGCIKQRTWKPLLPVIKGRTR